MKRAALGSALFLLVAPGMFAGLIPWWITGWEFRSPLDPWLPFQVAGALLLAAGVGGIAATFIRFVVEGRGTPSPVAPTENLVVGGLYRYVRNPMYSAVIAAIVGQALLFGLPALALYGAAFWLVVATFAHLYEEPTLSARYGSRYQEYRSAVPAWIPRLRPWRG